MKKEYQKPISVLCLFSQEDVLNTSAPSAGDPFGSGEDWGIGEMPIE